MEKKYTTYNEIDFAEEPSFIRWVQGKDPKATAFWTKWINKNPTKQKTIKAAKTLVQAISIKEKEPSTTQIKNLWDKIDAATAVENSIIKENRPKTTIVRSINRRRWLGYAAAACIGLIAFFVFYNPTTTVEVGTGEQLAYTLPDNSTIRLNAASTIHFKAGDFTGDRIVNLEGEAFFEVEKGQSFKVITPNGTVEVLGTSFNVNARDGGLAVICRTGKVRVTAKGSAQILTKGLGTKLNDDKTALTEVASINVNRKIGWLNGEFYLEGVPFFSVIEELERQFGVQINCDATLKSKIGDYSFKNDNLEKALDDIVFPLNATYKREGTTVTIIGE